jgi:hypothetical protein
MPPDAPAQPNGRRVSHDPDRSDDRPKIVPIRRNRIGRSGVYTAHMKRDTTSLVAATLRTGFLVGLAVILILVLFPAIAAQAAGSR